MLNPWMLIGLAVFWLASVTAAFFKGESVMEDRVRAQHATELERTIKQHNENAVIDMAAAAEAAARDATARTRAQMLRNQANAAIQIRPMPVVCSLNSERMRLLTASVEAANGDQERSAGGVFDAINKANAPRK